MNRDNPLSELDGVRHGLRAARVRRAVLVTGAADAVLHRVEAWANAVQEQWLWLSSRAPSGAWCMVPDKANHELGREADGVVVDLFDGWVVDAIAALAGVIRAGGVMVFMAPPLDSWVDFDDPQYRRITVEPHGVAGVRRHFLARMARWFATDARIVRLTDTAVVQVCPVDLPVPMTMSADDLGCRTPEQRAVVESILALAAFARTPPLLVQADRGRGKSAALGIAAALLARKGLRILATAPRPEAAETLLQFAGANAVTWLAPDRLVQSPPPADLLLIDEAAAFAPPMLLALLRHYSHVVLSTTVQGYEGTGQGFNTRFTRALDQTFPGWQVVRLTQPIRWASGDLLESFINDCLLLNACDEPTVPAKEYDAQTLTLEELTPQLANLSESRLRAVHGLLVAAHYRTRPSDLRTLLDGPNVRTFIATHHDDVVAVMMVAEEGRLPAALTTDIREGRRRPHGHVLPQSLAVHLNVQYALEQSCWRVVRIAVRSGWQRHGVGCWLLQQLESRARQEGIVLLGSLFAASADVLSFWQYSGFEVVRVGISREATSGAFPVLVLKGLMAEGITIADQARRYFERNFLHGLADTPDPWPAELVIQAWQRARFPSGEVLHAEDEEDIRQFIAGHKTYENVAVALARQLRCWMAAGGLRQLESGQQHLLIGRILQKRPWAELIERGGYSGQKQIRAALRDAIAVLDRQQPSRSEDCLSS